MNIETLLKYGFEELPFNYYYKDGMQIKVWQDGSMSYGNAELQTEEQLKLWYQGHTGTELLTPPPPAPPQ